MCGLEAYADAIVGSLEGELRKRTTIGVELAAKVKLLVDLAWLLTSNHVLSQNCYFSWTNQRLVLIRRVPGVSYRS